MNLQDLIDLHAASAGIEHLPAGPLYGDSPLLPAVKSSINVLAVRREIERQYLERLEAIRSVERHLVKPARPA